MIAVMPFYTGLLELPVYKDSWWRFREVLFEVLVQVLDLCYLPHDEEHSVSLESQCINCVCKGPCTMAQSRIRLSRAFYTPEPIIRTGVVVWAILGVGRIRQQRVQSR
jgi:hypothetical protein